MWDQGTAVHPCCKVSTHAANREKAYRVATGTDRRRGREERSKLAHAGIDRRSDAGGLVVGVGARIVVGRLVGQPRACVSRAARLDAFQGVGATERGEGRALRGQDDLARLGSANTLRVARVGVGVGVDGRWAPVLRKAKSVSS